MAKTLGEYISILLQKAGQDVTNEAFKNFLSNGELVKIEIPDEITALIDSNLISLKDAKNNHPDIKGHYQNQALTPFDQQLPELFEELGIPEEVRVELLKEKSTYKRVPALLRKVKELESKKANSGKDVDKAALQKQIDDLNAAIRTEKEGKAQLEKDYNSKIQQFKIDMFTDSLYAAHKTTFDALPPDVKQATMRTLINKGLQDKKAKLTLDEHGNIVLLTQEGANYYDGASNNQVSPQQFVDSVLAHNKVLVTTNNQQSGGSAGSPNQGNQGNQQNNGQGNPPGGNGNNGSTKPNPAFSELIAESIKDYSGQPAS